MEVEVLSGQSLLDIALEHTGSLEHAFELVEANAIALTSDLEAGSTLKVLVEEKEEKTLKFYDRKDTHPATTITNAQGIDYDNIPLIIY